MKRKGTPIKNLVIKAGLYLVGLIAFIQAITLIPPERYAYAQPSAEKLSPTALIERFTQLDTAFNEGEGYSNVDNAEGKLAWGESYLMEAYLTMYEATQDKKWLDKFVLHAQRVANNTDKARGVKDYRGRSEVGWSSLIYSPQYGWRKGEKIESTTDNKPWIMFWGHTGMIIYPFIKFGIVVQDNPALARYKEQAEFLLRVAEEAAAVFYKNWRFEASSGEGYFVAEKDEPARGGLRQPIDRDLAMGRAYIGLCKLGRGQRHCERAKALASMFSRRLILSDDRYIWNIFGTTLEDISHGAIDIAFACEAFDAHIEFTINDMLLLSRTLIRAFNGSQFAKFVDGSGDDDSAFSYSLASARWLDLSTFGCGPYKTVYSFFQKYLAVPRATVSPQVLLGISKLIRYWDRCM